MKIQTNQQKQSYKFIWEWKTVEKWFIKEIEKRTYLDLNSNISEIKWKKKPCKYL